MFEFLQNIWNSLSGNTIGLVAIGIAALAAYKKVMNAITQSREAVQAVIEISTVWQRAYADKEIDNEEIKQIEEAMKGAMKEGKEAVEAITEAKDEIEGLLEKANIKRAVN